MNKLLVVEDNTTLVESLVTLLGKHYEVSTAKTGRVALRLINKNDYHLIILDLSLPDISGEEVCQQIRNKGIKSPILVLTATSKTDTKVKLLDIGADDYLHKPFYISELQARVRALLRRSLMTGSGPVMRVGDLTLDSARREVERAGKPIELRRKEFDILEYMMHNRGTVLTRSMIISNSWEAGADRWNNTVDVHIKYLRDKIDRPFEKHLIKTAYGVGYMIDDA
jgi:DNA-binding response OmpR family regulator